MSINIPFRRHYTETEGKRMHYLDEGSGPIVLFAHGIPEWSMTYAKLIAELSMDFRCVIPDHIGFGLSEKTMDIDFTPKAHARRLLQFIKNLGLKDIQLVVHDLGGSIGLGALVAEPQLFSSVIICNSFLWDLKGTAAGKGLKLMQGTLGKWLYLNYGFSVKFMAKNAFADKTDFATVKEIFMHAHQTKLDRYANYRLMLEMLNSGAWYDECLADLKTIDLPFQLVWGMKDKFFSANEYLERWKKELPAAKVTVIQDSGHFPQIERPKELAEIIKIISVQAV
jgi:pimeloyl-ACP methyl ester carboxylesterase